jgi:hypothetical protein
MGSVGPSAVIRAPGTTRQTSAAKSYAVPHSPTNV